MDNVNLAEYVSPVRRQQSPLTIALCWGIEGGKTEDMVKILLCLLCILGVNLDQGNPPRQDESTIHTVAITHSPSNLLLLGYDDAMEWNSNVISVADTSQMPSESILNLDKSALVRPTSIGYMYAPVRGIGSASR